MTMQTITPETMSKIAMCKRAEGLLQNPLATGVAGAGLGAALNYAVPRMLSSDEENKKRNGLQDLLIGGGLGGALGASLGAVNNYQANHREPGFAPNGKGGVTFTGADGATKDFENQGEAQKFIENEGDNTLTRRGLNTGSALVAGAGGALVGSKLHNVAVKNYSEAKSMADALRTSGETHLALNTPRVPNPTITQNLEYSLAENAAKAFPHGVHTQGRLAQFMQVAPALLGLGSAYAGYKGMDEAQHLMGGNQYPGATINATNAMFGKKN